MSDRVFRSVDEPIREHISWSQRWEGRDRGLITCWEVGRRKRDKEPVLAEKASRGELPVLGWKGGVEKSIKKGEKLGTLYYLAQWQGLRGEDLDIDLNDEPEITCSRTAVKVVFTGDVKKYGSA